MRRARTLEMIGAHFDEPWRIELFGRLRVSRAGCSITRFRSRKAGLLLGYLACHLDRSHPRAALIEMLWPECEPAAGRQRLNQLLSSLRRQLEPPGVPPGAVILSEREWVRLNPAAVITDVSEFREAEEAARRAPLPDRMQRLTFTVEQYSGEILSGYQETWIIAEQAQLAAGYFAALRELVLLLEQAGDSHGAIRHLRRALQFDPLDETLQQELIRLLAASGQPAAALRQIEGWEERLSRELGLQPAAWMQELERQFRRQLSERALSLVPAETGGDRSVMGDGATGHEVRAAMPRSEPPRPETPVAPGYLPLRLTRFFGREAEMAQLGQALGHRSPAAGNDLPALHESQCPRADGPRLLTLTGPGGSGKTRLAIEVAERLQAAWEGAVWFVPLLELAEARLIPDRLVTALRLPREVHGDPLDQAAAFLRRQPSLLVMDNFEHLIPEGIEVLVRLLERVPGLVLLVTSRQRLGLAGELEFALAPLPVPVDSSWPMVDGMETADRSAPSTIDHQLSTLLECPSVRLFLDRAQAVKPDFQLTPRNAAAVAALCRRLEGLPLAIELAAARSRVTTPQQMLERLTARFDFLQGHSPDADPRHRSLRAALDWSYQLLPPELQRFLARLSAFRGGWTAEAAATVCEQPAALDFLQQLHESSLVQSEVTEPEAVRFSLLETLREFGDERLDPEERAALLRRHSFYYREVARQGQQMLDTGVQVDALQWLRPEHENFRAALTWGLSDEGDPELTLEAASLLHHHWLVTGRTREGLTYLEAALARSGAAGDPRIRRAALSQAGYYACTLQEFSRGRAHLEQALSLAQKRGSREEFAWSCLGLTEALQSLGDYEAARSLAHSANDIFEELGCVAGRGWAMLRLGCLASVQGQRRTAEHYLEEALTHLRKTNDEEGLVAHLIMLGGVVLVRGDAMRARALYKEALTIARRFNRQDAIANCLGNVAGVDEYEGNYARAAELYVESLALSRGCGQPSRLVWALLDMAGIERRRGDSDVAVRYLQEAEPLVRQLESRSFMGNLRMYEAEVATGRGDGEIALRHYGDSLAIWRELATPQHVPRCLDGLARLEAACDRSQQAARLLGTAAALRRSLEQPRPLCEQADAEALVATLRTALGEDRFEAAWREGELTSWELAIAPFLGEASRPTKGVVQQIPALGQRPADGQRPVTQADLTQREWERITPLLPQSGGRRGRPFEDHRRVINGILWKQRTGAPWRDLPARYGSWHTCHERYRLWRKRGLWGRIEQALRDATQPADE